MVSVFNPASYDIPKHVVDRWLERVSGDFTRPQAVFTLDCVLRKSRIILESERFRYLKYNDYTFTCKRLERNKYVVTTILTNDMEVYDYA